MALAIKNLFLRIQETLAKQQSLVEPFALILSILIELQQVRET
jgi:hypothetical protein